MQQITELSLVKDVYIDLLGYRKYGHNEGDEPRFTQPSLYKTISKHPNPREITKEKLVEEGVVSDAVMSEMEKEFKNLLDQNFDEAKEIRKKYHGDFHGRGLEKLCFIRKTSVSFRKL